MLDARRKLLSARQTLVDVKLQKLDNRITLYWALGGGESPDRTTVVGQTPTTVKQEAGPQG